MTTTNSIDPAMQQFYEAAKAGKGIEYIESTITPAQREEWDAWKKRQAAIPVAMCKPLPGAAGDAFTKGTMRVNGRVIYHVVPVHFRALQAVDSPLLKLYARANSTDGKAHEEFGESAEWEICYIFTTPPKQLRKMLEDGGAEAIKKAAEETIDGEWTGAEINVTVLGAVAQIHEHAKTTVAFEAEAEATSNSSFFQELRQKVSMPAESEKSSAT